MSWNSDSTFILGVKMNKKFLADFLSPLEYFVFEIEKNKIIFQETVSGGNVKWDSSSKIIINIVPGNIVEDEELNNLTYYYDVTKNEKIRNGE